MRRTRGRRVISLALWRFLGNRVAGLLGLGGDVSGREGLDDSSDVL